MIEFTPEALSRYRSQMKETLLFLPEFFRSPISKMKSLPNWDWLTILTLHAAFGASVGFIVGLLKFKPWLAILGIVTSTVSTLLIGFLGATFFYYFLFFILNRRENYLHLYTMVALASLPMLALRILSFIGPPISLIGFAVMCLLCTVSLVEVFRINRRLVLRLVGGVYFLFFLVWSIELYRASKDKVETREHVTPESLDILQKELQK